MQLTDWRGERIEAATSRGGVVAVANYANNLIRPGTAPWPPPPIVQKLYESCHSGAFAGEALALVQRVLGFYSDLQSLSSEDAITWSYFGPLMFRRTRDAARVR